jgi:hypothetical protein
MNRANRDLYVNAVTFQELYARGRLYMRYHVVISVLLLGAATGLFLLNINSFLRQSGVAGNGGSPPTRKSGTDTPYKEDAETRSLVKKISRQAIADNAIPDRILTVVILTRDRPWSLERLLVSLSAARYDQGVRVNLIVRQDIPTNGVLCQDTARIIRKLYWPHGSVDHAIEDTPRGPMRMWLNAYAPSGPTDFFIILEDDMEVSRFYCRWVLAALDRFRLDSTVFAVSASKPERRGKDPLRLGPIQSSVPTGITHVKYRMPTPDALAPIPRHWNAFRTWAMKMLDSDGFDPTLTEEIDVRDLHPFELYREMHTIGRKELAWTAFLVRYTFEVGQYTVYPWTPTGASLARSWEEPDALTRHGRGPTSDLLAVWDPALVRWNPRAGVRLDYTGRPMSP